MKALVERILVLVEDHITRSQVGGLDFVQSEVVSPTSNFRQELVELLEEDRKLQAGLTCES